MVQDDDELDEQHVGLRIVDVRPGERPRAMANVWKDRTPHAASNDPEALTAPLFRSLVRVQMDRRGEELTTAHFESQLQPRSS